MTETQKPALPAPRRRWVRRGVARASRWVYWELVDAFVDQFRRYEFSPVPLSRAEREMLVKTTYALRGAYRLFAAILLVLGLTACLFIPAAGASFTGICSGIVRVITFALAVWNATLWLSSLDVELRWVDLAFRHHYFRDEIPSQRAAVTVFCPTRAYLIPPLHMRVFNLRMRRAGIPLPPGTNINEPRFARRRQLMIWYARDLIPDHCQGP